MWDLNILERGVRPGHIPGTLKGWNFHERIRCKNICLRREMPSSGWEGESLSGEFLVLCLASHANSNLPLGMKWPPVQN